MKVASAAAPRDAQGEGEEIISKRLIAWLDEVLAGRAPNTGRFCGNCYHPLQPDMTACPHCATATADTPAVAAVPLEIIDAHRRRRGREGTFVRTIAWGGLTMGVTASLVPLAFGGVHWWSFALFFALLVFFYLLAANLANSLGDAWGYRSGLAIFRRAWERHIAARDITP
ncbi:MAG: hypothetical protein WD904_11270 [Dehalococcoidia bacterium]